LETLVTMLLIAAVLVVTAVLFIIWAAVGLVRLLVRGAVSLFQPRPRARWTEGGTTVFQCDRCLTVNPASAHFCRRCGQEVLQRQLACRQAAMW
jgi:ribosomal protein L40E